MEQEKENPEKNPKQGDNPYSLKNIPLSRASKLKELVDKPLHKRMIGSSGQANPTTVRSLRLFAESEKNKALQLTKQRTPGEIEPQFILELTKDIHRLGEKRVSEYIARNKTILLCDYALQIKQQDIYRMKDAVYSYEQSLDKDEKKLEQDAINFNQFIKSTNNRTAESVECALNQMKLRLKKQNEVRQLEADIFLLKSNIAHLEHWFGEYLLCAHFLKASAPAKVSGLTSEDKGVEDGANVAEVPRISEFTDDDLRNKENEDPIKIPFENATALLKAISCFRDQNLTIITNSHYLRNALKAAETKFKTAHDQMEGDIENYNKKIKELNDEIQDNQKTAEKVKKLTNEFKVSIKAEKENFEELLMPCVASTYELCTSIKGGQISLTMMVTAIEGYVLSLLFDLEKLPEKLLLKAHKAKQNERKIQKRKDDEKRRAKTLEERTKITDMRRFDSAKTKLTRRLCYKPQMTKGVKKTETLKTVSEDIQEDYHFFFG